MKGLLKKGVLVGIGAASLAKKKVVGIVKPLVKRRAINRKQAKELVKKVIAASSAERKRVERIIAAELKRAKPIAKKVAKKVVKKAKKVAKRALRRRRR